MLVIACLCAVACGSTTTLSASPTISAAASATATSSPTPTPTPTSSADASQATADALHACETWQSSDAQDAAQGSATLTQAAQQAAAAAALDSSWASLDQNMTFVASLPETGNSSANVAQAGLDITAIQKGCKTVNVEISD